MKTKSFQYTQNNMLVSSAKKNDGLQAEKKMVLTTFKDKKIGFKVQVTCAFIFI